MPSIYAVEGKSIKTKKLDNITKSLNTHLLKAMLVGKWDLFHAQIVSGERRNSQQ